MDEAKQPGIKITQIFLGQVAFSHRDDALALAPNTSMEVTVTTEIAAHVTGDETKAVVVVSIATAPDPPPLYNIRLDMIGLLEADAGAPNLALKEYAAKMAPAMMYPFVREAVYSLTVKGRFGPIFLAPLNVGAVMSKAVVEEHGAEPDGAK